MSVTTKLEDARLAGATMEHETPAVARSIAWEMEPERADDPLALVEPGDVLEIGAEEREELAKVPVAA